MYRYKQRGPANAWEKFVDFWLDFWLFIVGGLVVVALIVFGLWVPHATAKNVTFTVDDKVAAATSDGHEYQIFTTDGNVYADNDSVSFWKFNSSNVYAQLQKGHTYDCLVTGFRIPILSVKNNIIRCTEVN